MFSRAREDTVFVSFEHTERNNSGEVTSRFLTLCWWCHFSCFHHLQTLSRISFTLPITHLDFLLENAFSWKEPKIVSNQNPGRKTTHVEKNSKLTAHGRTWKWQAVKLTRTNIRVSNVTITIQIPEYRYNKYTWMMANNHPDACSGKAFSIVSVRKPSLIPDQLDNGNVQQPRTQVPPDLQASQQCRHYTQYSLYYTR